MLVDSLLLFAQAAGASCAGGRGFFLRKEDVL